MDFKTYCFTIIPKQLAFQVHQHNSYKPEQVCFSKNILIRKIKTYKLTPIYYLKTYFALV